jgi:lipoate-protein ligase A
MQSKITSKVEGGKLVRMELDLIDGKVKNIKITGDFFIHPEDSLQIIEKAFLTFDPKEKKEFIAIRISDLVKSQGIQMLGITPDALADVFSQATIGAIPEDEKELRLQEEKKRLEGQQIAKNNAAIIGDALRKATPSNPKTQKEQSKPDFDIIA